MIAGGSSLDHVMVVGTGLDRVIAEERGLDHVIAAEIDQGRGGERRATPMIGRRIHLNLRTSKSLTMFILIERKLKK